MWLLSKQVKDPSHQQTLAAPLNAVQPLLGTGVIRLGEGRATTVAMLSMALTIEIPKLNKHWFETSLLVNK
ncbi:hypothetical protein DY000_02038181 [Brassica cretica]|uniref:Uncharacterized protein n=1 Tax=Brassica cretica TaxID=69181 RepID=A0ABQ7B563_BRACR|nr:hypothetical protein DY000_02038181 [Brassica cretica]